MAGPSYTALSYTTLSYTVGVVPPVTPPISGRVLDKPRSLDKG